MRLQYQLSSGNWIDCEDRTEEFITCCEANNGVNAAGQVVPAFQAVRLLTRDEVIGELTRGTKLRNHPDDWYSNCRDGAPVEAKRVAAEAHYAEALAAQKVAPRRWGASGKRYDETCDCCGRVSTVDNDTGRCQRCSSDKMD
jgi:hypothetical protein